jgi:hypothetical protein
MTGSVVIEEDLVSQRDRDASHWDVSVGRDSRAMDSPRHALDGVSGAFDSGGYPPVPYQ